MTAAEWVQWAVWFAGLLLAFHAYCTWARRRARAEQRRMQPVLSGRMRGRVRVWSLSVQARGGWFGYVGTEMDTGWPVSVAAEAREEVA